MKIEANDTTIQDLLKYFFFIPRFQRPYSWEKEQVEQFWTDTVDDSPSEYFIGSMVLFRHGDAHGVVDGQQRLSTIVLALCAIRDLYSAHGMLEQAKGIQSILERRDIDNRKTFVLRTETSNPFLQEKLLQQEKSELETPLSPNAEEKLLVRMFELLKKKAFKKAIEPHRTKKKRLAALKKIRDRLLSLRVIKVELTNEDDAYIIFETLNSRGKDLQVSHLVKNHLFRLLRNKNKELDPAKGTWEKIIGLFEASQSDINPDAFLHHYWLSRDSYVSEKKLFKSMKKEITKSNALEILQEMHSDANTYRKIAEPTFGNWQKGQRTIRASLQALDVFRVRQPYPLILSTLRAYAAKNITKRQADQILSAVENFHFSFTAVASKSSSGGISMMYASLAQRMYKAGGDKDALRDIIKEIREKLRSRHPSKDDFIAGFSELQFSNTYTKQKKLVRYILQRIHEHHNTSGSAADYEQMTIEHVYPQNPESDDKIPESSQIGNLLLCDDKLQDKLKNKDFLRKRRILEESGYRGVDDILAKREWTPALIVERTRALADLAYSKLWRV